MKKIVCFGLCFLIVLCSFVLSFADSPPALLTVTDAVLEHVENSPYVVYHSQSSYDRYSANNSSVYFVLVQNPNSPGRYRYIVMSPNPGSFLYQSNGSTVTSIALSMITDDGYYYYTGNFTVVPELTTAPISDYVGAASDYVASFFQANSVVFDINPIVDGSVSWLSTMAQAVKSSGLLLFMVLIGFCGIGIGLFRRFTHG